MNRHDMQRVFIVDDEVMIAIEMADTLEDLGFEVIGPSVHLDEAEDRALNEDIDFALLDVNLGEGLTSEPVANILKLRNIPFVFVTAYDKDQVDFLEVGATVIRKPLSEGELTMALVNV